MTDDIKKNVDHPSHYNKPNRKECIVEMEEKYGPLAVYYFCRLNAFKYRYREGDKDGNPSEQDLQKAEWYDNYAVKMLQNENVITRLTVLGEATYDPLP